MTTTVIIWLVLLALFGLTALAFRRGNPSKRSMDAAQRGDGRDGDQTMLTTHNRMHGL